MVAPMGGDIRGREYPVSFARTPNNRTKKQTAEKLKCPR
jgi:hypothetical protein